MMTPEEVRIAFDRLTAVEKIKTGLVIKDRKNTSWKTIAPKVKAFAIEKKSFSLLDLKKAGVVAKEVTGQNFAKCILPILQKEGFVLLEQKRGAGRASLFHLEGHAVAEKKKGAVFKTPSPEAAQHLVSILNGKVGHIDYRKSMADKTFQFKGNRSHMGLFDRLVKDESGKEGWKSGSKPFIIIKEEVNNE